MKDKDKYILKDSALVTADAIASVIHPGVALAWSLGKALFGAGMKLREDRALEFIEFIKMNPSIFVAAILATTEFQDGFVYTLEKYLTQRITEKRQIIKQIFSGFTVKVNKHDFDLERLIFTTEQISPLPLFVLSERNVNGL